MSPDPRSASRRLTRNRDTLLFDCLTWIVVAIIAASYFSGLTPGHVFVQDDFAAYVMHAANLVEGRAYTDIRYVPNPEAPWVSPANGYPPVYPLLLAPVYWRYGLDLRTMKIVTVGTFAIFLAGFALWVRPFVSPATRVAAVILVGLNPAFWTYRDLIASEFPYLMFSFLALLAMRWATREQAVREWRPFWALLVALLLFASYGTRTIGIALGIAVLAQDVMRFRRPSRFVLLTLALLAGFMALQAAVMTSPKGYLSVVHPSLNSLFNNAWSYTKSLSHAWENGSSKIAEVAVTIVLSAIAFFGFTRSNARRPSLEAWYVLAYLAILTVWGAQIGIRGLLPILPIYLTYALVGLAEILSRFKRRLPGGALATAIALAVAMTYAGTLRHASWQTSMANVLDPTAQELFVFLSAHTADSDVLVFSKPRSLALYTHRPTASLGPQESANDSTDFLLQSGAKFVIEAAWSSPAYGQLTAARAELFEEVFRNRDFRVLRVRSTIEAQTTSAK